MGLSNGLFGEFTGMMVASTSHLGARAGAGPGSGRGEAAEPEPDALDPLAIGGH